MESNETPGATAALELLRCADIHPWIGTAHADGITLELWRDGWLSHDEVDPIRVIELTADEAARAAELIERGCGVEEACERARRDGAGRRAA